MTKSNAAEPRDIFFVSNSVNELGGITSWSHQMARLFAEQGHRVHVIGIVPPPEGRVHELGPDLPYRTTTLYDVHPPSVRPVRGLRDKLNVVEQRRRTAREAGMHEQAAKMTTLFRGARPGGVVIVTQVWAMEWVALADTAGLAVIGMSHESFETCRRSSRFARVKRFYQDVDRMLPLTREDADKWIRQRMDNVGFMPNPLPFFPDVPSDRSQKVVASIGRLHEEKGVDLLLEAWAKVAPQHPDWTLRIYGSGEEAEALRKQAAELGVTDSVEWMGRTSDVAGALRESAVFALSSRGEGFPLAPMEAMATAVPCVAFDVAPGVREIITDGTDGFLAPPGNITEFARHLDTLMSDQELRDRMGETARENIQRFSTDEIVGRWEALFALVER
ncbi:MULTISPECIES: glycosyltransferase [Streptomyces]|uniref:D-inositol 3-phosphate glycosyltransferase n=2 Tax=Streptomyces TaxID=1883 RepID=A0A2N8PNQ0_STRNR|nr:MULTISPECIES: glycosyltransferase [Streptomyces]PNE42654.1 glycosyl transferase [Streptomyces noursei]QRX92644.1 glycosyltransferase [Streptomyces noursei]UJB42367.1 glycosyltransferase [Streptomyces sp. A1-5]SHL07791.1 Glycosyltransferase involved in cell wall bisynthesis [Streptomyces yunnanensis]